MTTPPPTEGPWGGRPAARLREWARTHLLPVCSVCREPIDMTLPYNHPRAWTVDHIIPLALGGGAYDHDNIAPCHKTCNRLKGTHLGPFTVPAPTTPNPCTCRAWPEPDDPNCPAHYCRAHQGQCGGTHSRAW
jgi:5-methylcytosine-specific restriction endonuclease McrA